MYVAPKIGAGLLHMSLHRVSGEDLVAAGQAVDDVSMMGDGVALDRWHRRGLAAGVPQKLSKGSNMNGTNRLPLARMITS